MKNISKKIYFTISIIFVFSLSLNYLDWQVAGYYTEKIIAWIWIVSTLIFILIFWEKRCIKIYFLSIVGLIILSIIPMAIPFFAMINYLSKEGDYQQIKLNEKYRIERTQQHPLSMSRVYVYKKHLGMLEKNICRSEYREIIENVMNWKDNDSLLSINLEETPIQNAKLLFENNDSIGVEYKINNKRKIIYHKLNNEDGY